MWAWSTAGAPGPGPPGVRSFVDVGVEYRRSVGTWTAGLRGREECAVGLAPHAKPRRVSG